MTGERKRRLQVWPTGKGAEFAGLLVFLLTATVAICNIDGAFVFDDTVSIVQNEHIRSLLPLSRSLTGPEGSGSSGRPLVALSLALNYALGELRPHGYLLSNAALHALAARALFALVRRTLLLTAAASRALPLALVAALLWGLHPLHTAALDHVVYRSETLVALFWFLTLACVARRCGDERPRLWTGLAVLACAAAMASKEVGVGLPLAALAWDATFGARSWKGALRARPGLYAGLASTWVLLAVCVAAGQRGEAVGFAQTDVAPLDYLYTQAGAIAHYLRLSFWPAPLVFDYADWPVARSLGAVLPQALLVTALLVASLWGTARREAWGFPGLVFFAALAPSSSFVPVSGALVAEHRMVLPLAALVALVVVGAERLAARSPMGAGRWLLIPVVVAVPALAAASVSRHQDFESPIAIWRDTIAKRPRNWRAHGNLGLRLLEEGQVAEARDAFARAVELHPPYAKGWNNLGGARLELGELAGAEEAFRRSLDVDPDDATANYNYGNLLAETGRLAEAVERFERAAAADARAVAPRVNLGIVLRRLGRDAEAAGALEEALRVAPDHTGALAPLAWLRATSPDGGVRDGAEALRLSARLCALAQRPSARALDTLAAAQAEAGRFAEAADTAQRALAASPGALRPGIEARRALYAQGRAYREPREVR